MFDLIGLFWTPGLRTSHSPCDSASTPLLDVPNGWKGAKIDQFSVTPFVLSHFCSYQINNVLIYYKSLFLTGGVIISFMCFLCLLLLSIQFVSVFHLLSALHLLSFFVVNHLYACTCLSLLLTCLSIVDLSR